MWQHRISTKKCCPCTVNIAYHVKQSSKTTSFGGTLSWRWRGGKRCVRVVPTATTRILWHRFPGTCEMVGKMFKFVWRLHWKINAVCMSLSPFVSFQSWFVTYLLTYPLILTKLSSFASLINVQMSVHYLIQNTDTNLLGSKFPSNHLKLERSPGVLIFTHACGTVTVAQLSSRRCRYDPHFPSMYMFIIRSLFSCCRYSGKLRSNTGADASTIKKHLQQVY